MIFEEASIGLKSDFSSGHPNSNLKSEVALIFLSFCFPFIPWVDNLLPKNVPVSTEYSKSATTLGPTPSHSGAGGKDTSSDLSDISDEYDNDIPTTEAFLPNINTATPVQQQLACQKAQPTLN